MLVQWTVSLSHIIIGEKKRRGKKITLICALTHAGQVGVVGVGARWTFVLLGILSPIWTVVTPDAVLGHNDPCHVVELIGVTV